MKRIIAIAALAAASAGCHAPGLGYLANNAPAVRGGVVTCERYQNCSVDVPQGGRLDIVWSNGAHTSWPARIAFARECATQGGSHDDGHDVHRFCRGIDF